MDPAADRSSFASASIVELRQYTLRPGTQQTLRRVFEDHLVDGQAAHGIAIGPIGLDESDPDRFVWMRGFTGLEQRTEALTGFYTGPVWMEHRGVANGTMVDSDDVLLLQPTDPPHPPAAPAPGDGADPEARLHVSAYTYPPAKDLDGFLSTELHRALESLLAVPVATWRSHPGPNGFPQLPVRPDHAFVWAATFRDAAHRRRALQRFRDSDLYAGLRRRHGLGVQELDLTPTPLSRHPRVPST